MGSENLAVRESDVGGRRAGPAKLSHTHEDIARWMLENPTAPLGECARQFNYTPSWLSCIIHSDAFQTLMRKLQEEANAVTILDIPARLRGIAASALDGLAHQVDHALKPTEGNGVMHRQFLLDTAELTLEQLGYGAKAPQAPAGPFFQQINNFPPVDPATLARAREKLLNAEVTPVLQETSQLPAGGEGDLRTVQRPTTTLPAPSGAEGPEASGLDL